MGVKMYVTKILIRKTKKMDYDDGESDEANDDISFLHCTE